jgi:hypothetical protein
MVADKERQVVHCVRLQFMVTVKTTAGVLVAVWLQFELVALHWLQFKSVELDSCTAFGCSLQSHLHLLWLLVAVCGHSYNTMMSSLACTIDMP